MARRMDVNRLSKDKLAYELTVGGIAVGTIEEMRSSLLAYMEDKEAVIKIPDKLRPMLDAFSDTSKSSQYLKLQTKIAHILGRINNMITSTDAERKAGADLLASALSLIGLLNEKSDAEKKAKQFVSPSLNVIQGAAAGLSSAQMVPTSSPQVLPSFGTTIKPIVTKIPFFRFNLFY